MARDLTLEERHLWAWVTRNDEKYQPEVELPPLAVQAEKLPEKPAMWKRPKRERTVSPAFTPVLQELPPGHYAGIDRSLAERFRKGKLPIEARLDLHGLTQIKAEDAFNRLIEQAYSSGKRCLLVITGKGRREGQGILRERLPLWIQRHHPHILAYTEATPALGGSGAWLVLLRRARG